MLDLTSFRALFETTFGWYSWNLL